MTAFDNVDPLVSESSDPYRLVQLGIPPDQALRIAAQLRANAPPSDVPTPQDRLALLSNPVLSGLGETSRFDVDAGRDVSGWSRLTWPAPGYTQLNRRDPSRGQGDGAFGSPRDHGVGWHTGIDFTAPVGATVVAPADGTVVDLRPNPSKTYGNQVVIDHGQGLFTMSGHLGSVAVKPGDRVNGGDPVGTVGRTGDVPKYGDSHVHFEVRLGSPVPRSAGGTVVNPKDYLPKY